MSDLRHPPTPRDSWQSALADVEDFRDATPEEHYRGLVGVCRLAAAILEHQPLRALRFEEPVPLPADSLRLIARLRLAAKTLHESV
ncbi:MAG: hypothetical protein ACREXT_00830 [Gammaproteobacteria bacterium]